METWRGVSRRRIVTLGWRGLLRTLRPSGLKEPSGQSAPSFVFGLRILSAHNGLFNMRYDSLRYRKRIKRRRAALDQIPRRHKRQSGLLRMFIDHMIAQPTIFQNSSGEGGRQGLVGRHPADYRLKRAKQAP